MQKFMHSRLNIATFLAGLVLSYFMFPIVAGFLVQPSIVNLDYTVKTEGVYKLQFDHFVFLDPGTVFFSPFNDSKTEIIVTNLGKARLDCWISNYQVSNAKRMFAIHEPVLDQAHAEERPGKLLDDEGKLGARQQPYRTFSVNTGEHLALSFPGIRRTIECFSRDAHLNVLVDNKSSTDHLFSEAAPKLDITATAVNKPKSVSLLIPPYAFGTFRNVGPAGFELNRGTTKRWASSEQLVFGEIPFPATALFITLIAGCLLSASVLIAGRHLLLLLNTASAPQPSRDTPVFSSDDRRFLFFSALIIISFTGSLPPIHMKDSAFYIDTAANLRELFATHAYAPYRNPGYMIFIWLMQKFMGPGYGLILAQEFLFYVSAFLLYKTVEYFTHGNRFAASCAGFIYIFNPLNLIYSQIIQPEGFWRDLIVLWAFSLVLLMKRNPWAGLISGTALGLLLLSRASALPSLVLFIGVGCLMAWRRIPLKRYLFFTVATAGLICSPYYLYLRASSNQSTAYARAVHHTSLLMNDKVLDQATSCYADFQVDFDELANGRSKTWLASKLFSRRDISNPEVMEEERRAVLFEECLYKASYFRFPRQQLSVLATRVSNHLWNRELKDRDLWDYGRIYSDFMTPDRAAYYLDFPDFGPYFYAEKWDVQNFPSAWKYIFEFLYDAWPRVEWVLLVVASLCVLIFNAALYLQQKPRLFRKTILLITAFSLLYFADALIYSIFGTPFFRRMMLAVAPLMIIVFGICLGTGKRLLSKSD